MPLSSRFTIAQHMLTVMDVFKEEKVTSQFMAGSIGVNPVIIRRLLSQLRTADIVTVKRGSGGASISRDPKTITYLDVYEAVAVVSEVGLFKFHEQPNPACPVGKTIHSLLDDDLLQAQLALETYLKNKTVADLLSNAQEKIIDQV